MELTLSPSNEPSMKDKLASLPRDIQVRLYILCFRAYWREYVPLSARPPTWVHRALVVQEELYEAHLKNIHFLHLSFNTLESAKRYIPGCQCDYCAPLGIFREYVSVDMPGSIEMVTLNQMYKDSIPYHENFQISVTDYNFDNPLTHNTYLNKPGIKEYTEFNHWFTSRFESPVLKDLREGVPLYFSEVQYAVAPVGPFHFREVDVAPPIGSFDYSSDD